MSRNEAIQKAIEIIKRRRMMMVKVFALNGNGKIEMTEAELKKLLDDVYWDGYRDGGKGYTLSSTSSTSGSITIDASNLPTEAELKKLLDDVYWDGYRDGGKGYTLSSTSSTSGSITIDASNLPKAVSLAENKEYINW